MEAFKYGCIVRGDNFCARPALSRLLRQYIESGQNVVIQGERRIGKTSLVQETVARMRGWKTVNADFMGVRSVVDVCNRLSDALARFDGNENVFRKTLGLLAHLRPVATIDMATGSPTITVDAAASRGPESVNAALDAIAHQVENRKVCVIFDEFQDILRIPDGDQVMALMRARIQYMSDTSFVFLGSARNEMLSVFLSPKSPFYKSAAVFGVDEIPDDDFYAFARRRFATGRRELPRDIFQQILDFVSRTSGDVQELCDAIWKATEPGAVLSEKDIESGIQIVFARESSAYEIFSKPLTDIQLRVLHALASRGGAHVLAGDFLRAADVSVPMTVKRSLAALEKAGLVYAIKGEYKFVSPFFREWIRRRYR